MWYQKKKKKKTTIPHTRFRRTTRSSSSMAMAKPKTTITFAFIYSLVYLFTYFVMSDTHISLWDSEKVNGRGTEDIGFDPTKITQISWHPRAFVYKGFLSDEECDHLIALGRDKLEKSMVADNESGKSVLSEVRTSSGTFLERHQDEVVGRIEKRIATWTFLPEENGESIQILRYEKGQKYDAHYDYFHDKNNLQLGGHRMATALMYLSDVKEGGETVFPDAEGKDLQVKDDSWSDCAKNGLAVKPKKGDTLLFFNCHPNATVDPYSLHAACPVIEGEKWSATRWIHVRSFVPTPEKQRNKDECVDDNEMCHFWASEGECEKNVLYMVGNNETLGYCRKSCNVC